MASGGSQKSKTRDITPEDLEAFRGGLEQIFFDVLGSGFGLSDPSLGGGAAPTAAGAPSGAGAAGSAAPSVSNSFADFLRNRGLFSSTGLNGYGGGPGGDSTIPTPQSRGVGSPAFSDVAQLMAAPVTDEERAQIERIRGFAGISSAESAALSGLESTLRGDFLDPNNEVLQGYVAAAQRPIREQNERDVLAQRALFTRSGQNIQASSPYAAAFSDLQGSLYSSLQDTAAQILYPAFRSERENQLTAAGLAPQILSQIAQRNLQVLEAEGLPRLVAQQGIQNALSELDSRRNAVASALAAAAGLARPVTGERSSGYNVGILS